MGFNKRRITKENIVSIYTDQGIEGLKKYFTADALIVEFGIDTGVIIEYLTNDDVSKLGLLVHDIACQIELDK